MKYKEKENKKTKEDTMIYVERPCVRLAACRVNAGKSQKEWASDLGVDPGTVYNWENGNTTPAMPLLMKISELSGIPLGLIFLHEES